MATAVAWPSRGLADRLHGVATADRPGSRSRRWVAGVLRTLAVYLFAGWAYIAAIAVFRPDSLSLPVWHELGLRRDTFGAVCFVGSFASYVAWQLVRGHRRSGAVAECPGD